MCGTFLHNYKSWIKYQSYAHDERPDSYFFKRGENWPLFDYLLKQSKSKFLLDYEKVRNSIQDSPFGAQWTKFIHQDCHFLEKLVRVSWLDQFQTKSLKLLDFLWNGKDCIFF